jgi:haloalkane dehalogenase
VKKRVILNTLAYPETSWAVKLFLLAIKTPGVRDFLVSQRGLVGSMKFGVDGLAKIARELPRYEGEARLIYGEQDRIVPDVAKTMSRLKSNFPNSELTALPNCGHFLQEDDPETDGRVLGGVGLLARRAAVARW